MTQLSNVPMQPKPDAVERPMTLIEKLEKEVKQLSELKAQEKPHSLGYVFLGHHIAATVNAINIVRQHSDWIDVSVEPIKRTEFDSEAVLAIDVNGYTYNVTLADVVICGEKKREWTECKAKWNGEFWEAVEYVCQSEKLVAYKHIPKPPSEVQP